MMVLVETVIDYHNYMQNCIFIDSWPKLFSMYINDFCNVSKVATFILFAYDANLFCCDCDLDELIQKTNAELDLSLNVTKTNCMMFINRKLNTCIYIKIKEQEIHRVEVVKLLDILIDDKLTWKNHICLVKSKLSKCCEIMNRASFLIDRGGMSILCHSLFLPFLI